MAFESVQETTFKRRALMNIRAAEISTQKEFYA